MSRPLSTLAAALAVTVAVVGTGVWLSGGEPARVPTPYTGTPLADVDTSLMALDRSRFCDVVAPEALDLALGDDVTERQEWVDGDELDGVGVVHEYGCRFTTDSGAEAAAWLFAPPITVEAAERLGAAASAERRCRSRSRAPAYGEPSVALLCPRGERRVATYRGLFGDAWLACSLTLPTGVPRAELLARADRWCVAVAEAARR